jgi:hypothetical protein
VAGVVLHDQGLQLEELRSQVRGYCQAEQARRPEPVPLPFSALSAEVGASLCALLRCQGRLAD